MTDTATIGTTTPDPAEPAAGRRGRPPRLPLPGALTTEGERPRWVFWVALAVAAILIFGVAPVLLSEFRLNLLAKFFCFGIVASGIGLAWGRGGMLTLGHRCQ